MAVIGLDTSNYTTSAAVYDNGKIIQSRRLLPVEQGKKGLRQSDAVFLHTRQIHEVIAGLGAQKGITAFGASRSPRDNEDSYMPCFLVGRSFAESMASLLDAPCHLFSHQAGHLAAAIWSAGRMDLLEKEFLAFHVSGGTFEALFIQPDKSNIFKIMPVADTSDLTAGQAIDRIGVMLGLPFPCGAAMERLALNSSRNFHVKPSVKNGIVSFSGLENLCGKMYNDGERAEDISKFCFDFIATAIHLVKTNIESRYPGLPVLFAGGVMSNTIIKAAIKAENTIFAPPEFASDNAAGIVLLTALKEGCL